VDRLSREPVLLVASDFDGTMAPIVENPEDARPHREAIVALTLLASLPRTHVAVISGRALSDLSAMVGMPGHVHLVGSHGSEFDPGFHSALPDGVRALRDRIGSMLEEIVGGVAGLRLEFKPASVAVHYRQASRDDATRALEAVRLGPGSLPGVQVKHGKEVVELCAVETDKGAGAGDRAPPVWGGGDAVPGRRCHGRGRVPDAARS
jgi:trehalose 6-phosphate phosphatase